MSDSPAKVREPRHTKSAVLAERRRFRQYPWHFQAAEFGPNRPVEKDLISWRDASDGPCLPFCPPLSRPRPPSRSKRRSI